MSDSALREDVIAALRRQPGIDVRELADGSVEVSKVDQPIRRLLLKVTVSRGMLAKCEPWYGVPMAAYFPSTSVKPHSNVSGE